MKTKSMAILVVAVALLMAACSLTRKTETPDDAAIKDSIQAKLYQDATLKTRDVHVDSQKGVVTLTGTVASDMEKLAVEGLARQATGVTQVVDQLTVSNNVAALAPAPAKPAASLPASEQPRKSKHARRVKASSESSRANEAPAPAPAPAESAASQAKPATPSQPPSPPPPVQVTVPAGTVIRVQMIDSIDSAVSRAGEVFAASLEAPIVVGDQVVMQRGADVRVRVVNAVGAGHVEGRSELKLELVSISANGTTYDIQTGYYDKLGASRGKRTAETVGGATGLGALIGGIFGGGKGAAIGAGVGAAGGGTATAASKGEQVKIPSESKLDFTLKSPFTVTLSSAETAAPTGGAVEPDHPNSSRT